MGADNTPDSTSIQQAAAGQPDSADVALLKERFGDSLLEVQEVAGEIRFEAVANRVGELAVFLRDDPGLAFDYPADLAAYDTGEELIVWYRLWSMSRRRSLTFKVRLPREEPVVASVTPVWPGMNWHERESFDLYGIRFAGHPDEGDPTRMRILMPEDWEGHPFRKDYEPVFSGDPLHGPQETN